MLYIAEKLQLEVFLMRYDSQLVLFVRRKINIDHTTDFVFVESSDYEFLFRLGLLCIDLCVLQFSFAENYVCNMQLEFFLSGPVLFFLRLINTEIYLFRIPRKENIAPKHLSDGNK